MKLKSLFLLFAAFLLLAAPLSAQQKAAPRKVLVAYYSLRNGNTRVMAEQIRKQVGGDLFRIETVQTYPAQYSAVTAQAKKELASGYRPKLKRDVGGFDKYDVIYVGSPCWWGTIAPAVFTFLGNHGWKGKVVVPFMTHEGSGMGHSETDIRKLTPGARVLPGLPVRGGSVSEAEGDVKAWLKRIGQLK